MNEYGCRRRRALAWEGTESPGPRSHENAAFVSKEETDDQ